MLNSLTGLGTTLTLFLQKNLKTQEWVRVMVSLLDGLSLYPPIAVCWSLEVLEYPDLIPSLAYYSQGSDC